MHTSNNFTLRGGDAAFANRQQALFDQLLIAESNCNKHDKPETDNMEMVEQRKRPASSDDRRQKRETKRFSGKESIFKRPEGPAPRTNFRNIPDYHRNPHKWVKYSLDDVSNEDMTEHSNTQAAMSFLRELKARRKKEEIGECEEEMNAETCESNSTETQFKKRSSSSQITFKKPRMRETMEDIVEPDDKPIFRSSKIILPEYVIGQKPKRTCKQNRPVIKVDRSKELRLDHLQEPDKEEDD
ncbi:Protein TSSC4 [Atta colombica]|uniref:U5 small nuclear ribonucleoprotein TSSC4 n=1 Tax=Atta colombica TaxID=520822 RepID=A0A195BVS1_9HYME|nr:PREDICTED: protein TSSC4 [Atta colombica]XP_018049584.1 PREDICTED: protein TSSC4 [Atta colombica]KYM92677.1 Protein TSSC4 [Atta colombica]